ncbi:Tripartite-type tricarboxylate transporter, receptor component TctC [Roseomonas rosea]|uniref:Tripartite-type tricarboxylate transporter, receptor component TctC n=1 Tax=Muricoccus roseus TaxID=198092 RepID=A0A1M6J069_9PROT|nr:tripartite tricarboxylate transporter substrate binding protein [Roseomonas rosea]SHJ40098.1 Tripartite-type tricarboxylate transporter, receptor component TctC [Roseomonas rosea]
MKGFQISRRAVLGGLGAVALPSAGRAQPGWPDRPVRIIVGFVPGGPSDTIARLLAPKLQAAWGQPVIVENRAGADGVIATESVVRSPADGHVLLHAAMNLLTSAIVHTNVPYDVLRDLTPIYQTASSPTGLLVHPSLPVRTVAELVAYAKARPHELSYSTSGAGGSGHFAGEIFKAATKTEIEHVAYRGTAPALQDLIAGQVKVSFSTMTTALVMVKEGRARALAVTSEQRMAQLPDVPTFTESGYPTLNASVWYGLFAPSGTPRPVVDRIADDADTALKTPEFRRFLDEQASLPGGKGPGPFRQQVEREMTQWRRVAEETGIRME